jgi:hypothetical protein
MSIKSLLAALTVLPLAAAADGFEYTYVEAGYINSEIEAGAFDVDGDGLGLKGSYALNDTLHAFAGYSTQDLDLGVDTSWLDIGMGGHWALQQNMDFVAELAWVNAEVDTPFGSVDEDGFGLGAGLRFRPRDRVELQGTVNYVDLDGSDTSLALSGRYYLWSTFALGGGLEINDDDTAWSLGVRAEFGGR